MWCVSFIWKIIIQIPSKPFILPPYYRVSVGSFPPLRPKAYLLPHPSCTLCPRCWISQALWLYIFILPIFRSFLSPWRGVICLLLRHSLGSYKDPRGLELGCLSEIPIFPTWSQEKVDPNYLPSYSPSPTIKAQILGIGVWWSSITGGTSHENNKHFQPQHLSQLLLKVV